MKKKQGNFDTDDNYISDKVSDYFYKLYDMVDSSKQKKEEALEEEAYFDEIKKKRAARLSALKEKYKD